ncbi:VP5 [Liao ning virus]|uniref:VP5 n=1 Tax=Liao ning virus TaxID=246280 RepID=Q2TPU6_9REOV|nr:VP5 [Liao ning virus]AAW29088.1 VP5 [Liao ning virus]
MYQQIDFNAVDYSVLYNPGGQLVQPTAIVGSPVHYEAVYPTPMLPYTAVPTVTSMMDHLAVEVAGSSSGFSSDGCLNVDLGLQQENHSLKKEISDLRSEVERLTAENNMLRSHVCERMNTNEVVGIADKATKCVDKFQAHWDMMLRSGNTVQHKGLKLDSVLLARIDTLYRLKIKQPSSHPLIRSYFPDAVDNEVLYDYVRINNHFTFLKDCYNRVLNDINPNDLLNRAIELCALLHFSGFNAENVTANNLRHLAGRKYEHDIISNSYPYKVDMLENDTKVKDHIYGKHDIDINDLTILHLMSHLSVNVTGTNLARYHVGNSCRITESSVLELPVGDETRYFKPLKCSGPYAIFERLPCEKDYRVNGLLHHFGVVPITLVRDIVEIEPIMEDYFISGPVGPSITCLMKTYALNHVEIVFGEKGLYVRPTGSKDLSKTDDCCRQAFALNNERTRCHKQLKPGKRNKKSTSRNTNKTK